MEWSASRPVGWLVGRVSVSRRAGQAQSGKWRATEKRSARSSASQRGKRTPPVEHIASRRALPDASVQIQLAPRGSGENGWSVSEKPRADVIALQRWQLSRRRRPRCCCCDSRLQRSCAVISHFCDRAVRTPRNAYAHCFGCCKRPINFSIDPLPPSSPAPPPPPPPPLDIIECGSQTETHRNSGYKSCGQFKLI